MKTLYDKSDNYKTYYPNHLNGFGLIAKKEKLGEEYLIQCYDPAPIIKDRREALIRIFHFPPFKGKRRRELSHPPIYFVIDLTNHDKMTFHLNLSGLSKTTCHNCLTCKKHFESLNHLSIVSKVGINVNNPYKIIDWDATLNEITKQLTNTGFFQEFPNDFKHRI